MAEFRAPIAVAALAAIAWLAVALDAGVRAPAGDARKLVPGLTAAGVTRVEVRRGDAVFTARREGDGFQGSGVAAVDNEVLDRLLGALEHTWVRRLRPGEGHLAELGLAEPRAITTVAAGGAVRALALGVELADRDLVWVRSGGDAALITATEARQLFPPPEDLRDRRPFKAVDIEAFEIIAGDRAVSGRGDPLEVGVAGGEGRADADELEALVEKLRELELWPGERGEPVEPLIIRLTSNAGQEWIEIAARCAEDPDRLAATSSAGAGCVDGAALERARELADDPLALVEDRLVDPTRRPRSATVRRGDEDVVIDPTGPGRDAALDWLARLAGAATGPPRAPEPGAPDATVEIDYTSGDPDRLEIRLGAIPTARRAGEPVAFPVAGIAALLDVEPVWFRAPELIERDPIELISARAGGKALDTAAIAPVVAHLTAERFVAERRAPEHGLAPPRAVIELRFSPPPLDTGEPNDYRLEIGAAVDGGGCYARLGEGAVFILADEVCGRLLGSRP